MKGESFVKFFRYRKPSAKTLLGLTTAKKRIRKATGITAATRPFRMKTNLERRVKRKLGYYSTPAKIIRNKRVPTPLGCLIPTGLLTILVFLGILVN